MQGFAPSLIVFEGFTQGVQSYVFDLPERLVRLVLVGQAHCALHEHHEAIDVHLVERERLLKSLVAPQLLQLIFADGLAGIRIFVEIFQVLRLSSVLLLFKCCILLLYYFCCRSAVVPGAVVVSQLVPSVHVSGVEAVLNISFPVHALGQFLGLLSEHGRKFRHALAEFVAKRSSFLLF